ncbi:MAG: M4 family metallopeptidase [Halobacteriota archaeon]
MKDDGISNRRAERMNAIVPHRGASAVGSAPVQGIIPPLLLYEIIKHGDEEQQEWAVRTLSATQQLRGRRHTINGFTLAVPAGERRRTVYDAMHREWKPGKRVRGEGMPPVKDPVANEVFDALGATYDFYVKAFGRNSIDNHGMRLDATIHYNNEVDNAFWEGTQMMFYDPDGKLFVTMTKPIDVTGHELTHGVTQYEGGLNYQDESGALNESMSDVFGIMVKQWELGQTVDEADWIIGEGVWAPQWNSAGLRSMAAPGTAYDFVFNGHRMKDEQPADMKDFKRGTDDNGYVHDNSGIPNHAFYLAAKSIGGYAWEKTGKIWYAALTGRLRPESTIGDAAAVTIEIAGQLYGRDGAEQEAVRYAWEGVGVKPPCP